MDDATDTPQQPAGAVAVPPTQPGPTLLPAPFAHAVSLATRSTSLAIRVGSLFGGYGLDAARFTTLSSLELARAMVEGVLSRAARDTLARSGRASDRAVADAESALERSLERLHHAVTSVAFWTAAGFQLGGTTLSAASEASRLLLSSFDQLFGSTDSSRAIASIITLIRREFQNPATGGKGERVGVIDLVLALGALAYLQRGCWRSAEEERRRLAYEEVIWDVVVLNDGQRVDVHEDSVEDIQTGGYDIAPREGGTVSRPVSVHQAAWQTEDDEAIMTHLKAQIASSLSPGTNVSISNSVSSIQTITVDVTGPQLISLPTPPGAEVVETRPLTPSSALRSHDDGESSYRVVYKIERNKFRATAFRREDEGADPPVVDVSDDGPLMSQGPTPALTFNESLQATDIPSPGFTSADTISYSEEDADARPPRPPPKSPPDKRSDPTKGAGVRKPSKSQLAPSENAANQKKPRAPLRNVSSRENLEKPRQGSTPGKKTLSRKKTESSLSGKAADKKNGLKQVLKGGGQSLSNIWNKDTAAVETAGPSSIPRPKPQWRGAGAAVPDSTSRAKAAAAPRTSKPQVSRLPPGRHGIRTPEPGPRSSSRASFVSIHERRRDSIVSQTDSFSLHSAAGMRPASPTVVRTEVAAQESLKRPRSGNYPGHAVPPSPVRGHHRRISSHVPSLYSLASNDSQASLVLSSYYQKSAYSASDALATLRREGFVDGSFPSAHLLHNITRYMRFSSASYGSHFLKMMGISKNMPALGDRDITHNDVRHFVHHTESQADNIILASFVDPQGGTDSTGSTGTGVPLVHYISLDHEAKAVVLACRGTLGFEDVMADMSCDYDNLVWRGRSYRVHKGVHASARRLIYGADGRVLITLKEALQEFPEYGVVLCGHSLGGAVTAVLGAMLSEPNPNGRGFVTSSEPDSRLLTDGTLTGVSEIRLPAGRRIHVYAYGPPGCMSRSLCKITRGLVTSVVHGNDMVPYLSLGVLHDLQAVALSFKKDDNPAKAEIRQRMWGVIQDSLADRWYGNTTHRAAPPGAEDEAWMLPALRSLRAGMRSEKLMPPGEVFAVESTRVLRRDAFLLRGEEDHIGRPARRVVLRYVKDVEARFAEVRFGASMLVDHSPAKYEDALNKLRRGVAD